MQGVSTGRAEVVLVRFRQAVDDLLAGNLAASNQRLKTCIALDPDFAPAWSMRAGIRVRAGRYEEAMHDINRALALRPGHVGDLHNRAVVWTALEKYGQAIADYEAVLLRQPGSAGTLSNLAWVLATARDPEVRDGPRALKYAQEAVRGNDVPAWLDTLAAAHAECGDFDSAVAVAEDAYHRSNPPNMRFKRRLELYRCGRTFVEARETDDEAGT
jgi:tetratricopeptide (TPR) repeat protein